jgi:hypothetical protein
MLRVLFDFVVDTRSNPLGAGISDSRPFAKNAKERGTHCVGDASEIKAWATRPARRPQIVLSLFQVTKRNTS